MVVYFRVTLVKPADVVLCEDIAFRVLAANNTPDFRTISDFRKDHLRALAGLFLLTNTGR
jgi:transposase